MKFDREQILALLIAQNTIGITDKEKTYLDKVLAQFEEARQLQEDVLNRIASPEAVEARDTISDRIQPESLMNVPVITKKWYLNPRIGLSVAASVLAFIGLFMVTRHEMSKVKTLANTKLSGNVELVLADGQVFQMSLKDTVIKTGGVDFSSKNNTLTYSAGTYSEKRGINTIKVPAGKYYNIVLEDGTSVMLNSTTRLQFPFAFTGNSREIWVDGEAYLDIKSIPNKPFIVHLPTSTVKVLGTTFNVNTFDSKDKVALVKGKVMMIGGKDSTILNPSTQGTYSGIALQVAEFNVEEVGSWRTGVYIFHDNSISEVAGVLSRWYGYEVEIDSSVMNTHLFGAIERAKPVTAFLEKLKTMNEIEYTIVGNVIHLR